MRCRKHGQIDAMFIQPADFRTKAQRINIVVVRAGNQLRQSCRSARKLKESDISRVWLGQPAAILPVRLTLLHRSFSFAACLRFSRLSVQLLQRYKLLRFTGDQNMAQRRNLANDFPCQLAVVKSRILVGYNISFRLRKLGYI